jgi:hypothetical protein
MRSVCISLSVVLDGSAVRAVLGQEVLAGRDGGLRRRGLEPSWRIVAPMGCWGVGLAWEGDRCTVGLGGELLQGGRLARAQRLERPGPRR